MYNDNEYRDLNEEQQKNIFDFDRNEIVNTSNKQIGGEEGPFTLKKEFVTIPNKSEFENENKSEFENEFEFESKSENEFENKEINESNEEKIEDYLIKPLVGGLTEEILNNLYEKYKNDADIIALNSTLNTFIVTYLGCCIRDDNTLFTEIKNNATELNEKNVSSLRDILNSLDYIIYDFLVSSSENSRMLGYADLFILLKCAFCHITEKTNSNLSINNFDLLVSPDVINQFIINYISYLFCNNIDEIVHFFPIFSNEIYPNEIIQKGGVDEEKPQEFEIEVVSKKRRKKIKVPLPKYEESKEEPEYKYIVEPVEGYWTPNNKMYFNVAEYVFVMHNNLLTTISRGIFVKLGIWQKIFGENYIFGNEQMNMITLDKLKTIYPFDINKNNELVCLQILILKRILLEMSPVYSVSFGAKIDEDLKDYLDSFYNEYYLDKNKKAESSPNFPEEAYNELMENTGNNIIDEDLCNDNEFNSGFYKFEGGGQIMSMSKPQQNNVNLGDIEMITRPEVIQNEEQEDFDSQDVSITSEKEDISSEILLLPILFNKLKKAYQNNVYVVQNLKESKIPSIEEINNLYDLLKENVTLITKNNTFKMPAPKYKFIINNAANTGANINGMRLFYSKKSLDEIVKIIEMVENDPSLTLEKIDEEYKNVLPLLDEIKDRLFQLEQKKKEASQGNALLSLEEYTEIETLKLEYKNMERQTLILLENKYFLLKQKLTNNIFYKDFVSNYKKWFLDSQPFLGLYLSIKHGIFCPTTSMMDAMDNCSLKYGALETKEVGTTNYELLL